MRFPRSITLGPLRWRVLIVDKEELDDDWGRGKVVGDFGTGEIRVSRQLSKSERWRVLIHEILHLCFDQTKGTGSGRTEEEVTSRIDAVLAQVLHENFGVGTRKR